MPLGKLYFHSVAALGTFAAVMAFGGSVGHAGGLWTPLASPVLWAMAALGVATELVTVPLPQGGRLTASFAVLFAALILLGPRSLVFILIMTTVVASAVQRRPWQAAWFNFGQYSIAYLSAALFLRGGRFYADEGHTHWPWLMAGAVVYLVVNIVLVSGYIALEKRVPLHRVFWEDDRWELLFSLVQAPVSVLLVVSYQAHAWLGAALVVVPLLGTSVLFVVLLRMREARSRLRASLAELGAANLRLDGANRELTLLHGVAQKIVSQIDLKETLRLIARESAGIISGDEVLLYLVDPETGELALQRSASGSFDGQLEACEALIGRAVSEQSPVRVEDLAPGSAAGDIGEFRSLLAVPITGDDRAAGAIAVLGRAPGQFSEHDQELLWTLASYATFAIRNAQLYRATQQLAITDGLTGVYNRRYFQRQLENELRRAPRYAFATSLIILDVDHFKAFNDGNGHLLGDQVLRSMAQILKDSVRETDVVARYGGEEFAVILPETGHEVALAVAERIRSKIRAHVFTGKGQKPARMTASLGIASHPTSETTPEELIDRADKALYKAKNLGRDRVCSWSQGDVEPQERKPDGPEPTVQRRLPTRVKVAMDITAWQRYLKEAADPLLAVLTSQLSAMGEIDGSDLARWGHFVEQVLDHLGDDIAGRRDEETRLWSAGPEVILQHPLYAGLRASLSAWFARGVPLTSSENFMLGLCDTLGDHIRLAPFSPQEQLTVLAVVGRFSQFSQLAVSASWQEFFQESSVHLLALQDLEARLRDPHGLEDLLVGATSTVCQALGAEVGVLLVAAGELDPLAPDPLIVRASFGLTAREVQEWAAPPEALAAEALRTREPQLAPDLLYDPRANRPHVESVIERTGIHRGLAVPLVHRGAPIGVLELYGRRRGAFSVAEIRLAQAAAAHVAAAIERFRLEAASDPRTMAPS